MNNPIWRYDIEQNTDEWFEIKNGMFSASSADSLLMAKTTKGYTGLINRIVEERITGSRCENNLFKGNWATERGHELEPIAREDFEIRTLQVVKLVGVVIYDDWALCSPDGFINNKLLHQIKCPIFSTQKEYHNLLSLDKSPIATNYYKQMNFEMLVTGADHNIFTSFHPHLKPIDITLDRDEVLIQEIINRLGEAKIEVSKEIERIKNF